MKKYIAIMVLIIILISIIFWIFKYNPSKTYFKNDVSEKVDLINQPTKTSFIFVGDIMLGRGVKQIVDKYGEGDFNFIFKNTEFLKNHNIVFGNLEGPISDKGRDLGNLYSFRFEPKSLIALQNAGFNVFSVANNHAGDWGKLAFEDSINRLKNSNIIYVGGGLNKDDSSLKIINNQNIKIGFLGFSGVGPNWLEVKDNQSGILILKENEIENIIKEASLKVDILIVSVHFGEEYEKNANATQRRIYQKIIDSGAKMVIGHHPHVIQEVEEYNGGLIAYSLGNFVFDQNFSEETMEGLVLEVFYENKEMISFNKKIIKINNYFQPYLEKL